MEQVPYVLPGAVSTYSAKSALFTAGYADRGTFFDSTGTFTITLDTTSMSAGWSAMFRTVSGTQTFDPTSTVTINGASTYAVSNAGDVVLVVFDGTNFQVAHTQRPSTVAISGGTINGTAIGGTTAAAGAFTTVTASGDSTFASRFAIGTLQSGVQFVVSTNTQTATTQVMNQADAAANSNATASFRYYMCSPNTAAASFTLGTMFGFLVTTQTLGSGSTVTRFAGFHCLRSAIAGTGNAAFSHKSNNTLAFSGNWCLYNDTADDNYMGTGATLIGAASGTGLYLHGTLAAYPSNDGQSYVVRTTSTGSAPFDEAGHIVIVPRTTTNNARDFIVAVGSTTPAEKFRVDRLGSVSVGNGALVITGTDGYLYIPTVTGTPATAPTTKTGRSPLVIDSNANKLYFYSGGAWRDAGP